MHGSQMIYAIAFILLQGCNSTLAALFAPARPELGRYEVCAEATTIEAVVAAGRSEGLHYSNIEVVEPLDAFGAAGSYDRSRVVRLYGGSRPQVARGWRQQGDRFESITLISPYPDESLARLIRGTLVIRWII
jgi:hypothetical protein